MVVARPGDSYYVGLAQRLTGVPDSLRGELDAAASGADAATVDLGAFLRRELLPLAREQDACGPEIYARAARYWLGATVDLAEAYAWSWEEIARLRAEQDRIANLIQPGATAQQAVAILDADPARRIEGSENFGAWMQDLAERAIAELHGAHFDIPEPARRLEAVIAPTHDGGVYYTGPSEDWHLELKIPNGAGWREGERMWLEAREESRKRTGAAFNRKDFHTKALSLGPLGLDPLRETLARI